MATHRTPRPVAPPTPQKPGPVSPYWAALEKVMAAKSGDWREVAKYGSPTTARTVLGKIRSRRIPIPRGKWRFATERHEGGSRLLALYVGKGDEIAWYRWGELVTSVPAKESRAKSAGGKNKGK